MTSYNYYPSATQYKVRASAPAPAYEAMATLRPYRSVSPPGLTPGSTPNSSPPTTPILSSSFPKMSSSKPQVGFAYPATSSAYRRAQTDERYVMRLYVEHATVCDRCCDPVRTYRRGQTLCSVGTSRAKDLGKYFYCYDGKPYSVIDRKHGREKVQVEVPVDFVVVKELFDALKQGLRFKKSGERAEVHQPESRSERPTRPTTSDGYAQVRTSNSGSRRQKETVYNVYNNQQEQVSNQKYETRSPFDAKYKSSSEEEKESEKDKRPRNLRRGSLYVPADRRREKRASLVLPFPGIFR